LETVTVAASMLINILKVVFGLGFVIFIHELGHFLAAKWNGVKVEKFFLGFDWPFGLKIASFRYGETLYGIGILPLGGYVKMLGETPEEGGDKATDPRAFSNKSIGARIIVLSAGVVMNLLLGLALFTTTFMLGVTEVPAKIKAVQAGSPAYEAGIRPGDEIVSLDGRKDIHYDRLRLKVALSGPNQVIQFGVNRPGVGELIIPIVPTRKGKADKPNIGVIPADSLELFEKKPYIAPPGIYGKPPEKDDIPGGGKIIEAGPSGQTLVPVADTFALRRIFAENRDKPVDVVIESPKVKDSPPKRVKATLPASRMIDLGIRLTAGPITSIQAGSIADKAGFRVGDVIVKVDGSDDYDPMRLPEDLFARAGKPTTFAVDRKGQSVEITATPDDSLPGLDLASLTEALKIPGLGLALEIEPKIAAVVPGGPADKVGVKPGATIAGLTFTLEPEEGEKAKPTKIVFGKSKSDDEIVASWPYAILLLQEPRKGDVDLLLAGSSTAVKLTPAPDPTWWSDRRGLQLNVLSREVPPQPFLAALKRGADETYDNVISIYAMIRSLFQGRVSTSNLAGLPRIGVYAYRTATLGFVPLMTFLGMLSINLAVLNFLPISPLDGGQIAFLVAEKIRGKPLPDSAHVGLFYAGAILVVCLMLFTIFQDLKIMIFG
jgi:regulator of sigma E protease